MGAATRPAEAQRSIAHQRRWLIAAGVCLSAATLYLCVALSEAVHDTEPSLPALLVISEKVNSVPVAEAAEQPPLPGTTSGANSPPPPVAQATPGRTVAIGSPELLDAILDGADGATDHVSIAVRRISDGRTASLNGDVRWYAASLFKLAVLYEVEKQHFGGAIKYDARVTITEEDFAQDLGTAGHLKLAEDGTIAVEDLLRAMIEISDNVSAVTLLHLVGSGNIDATLRGLGIETMTVNSTDLWTTAEDEARLMEAIYTGEAVGSDEREHMRELLLGQAIRGGIPGALSQEIDDGLRVGNKTGTWEAAQHDVAFIEAQSGAYVIAILTDGSYAGWQGMHRVTQKVHAAMLALP